MGPGPAGSTDAVCVVAGGSPEPRSVEPLAAVCLEETSRQRGVLALGLVVGALGKPYACAQAAMRCTQAGSLAYFARVGGSFAAGFFCASRFERSLRNFDGIAAAGRFDFDTLVKFFGLAARLSFPVSAILCFLLQLISIRYTSRTETRPTFEPAAHLVLPAVGEQ